MKKTLSVMLSVILAASTMMLSGITAFADTSGTCGTNGDNVLWTLASNGTMTISKGSSGEGRMADFVNNGGSRPAWYDSRGDIKKLVIEEGVVNVGAYAFDHCYNLAEIDFGTIDTLGNNAFMNCTSLTSISLPSSFNWMYGGVFEGCTSLKSAYLGERWWTDGTVPNAFFKNCTALQVVRMGTKFTGFESDTFDGCTSLKAIISDNTSLSLSGVVIAPTTVLGGTCSTNTYSSTPLTYAYDLTTLTLSFTGSGDMDSTPWEAINDAIDTVTFAKTDAKTSVSTTAFKEYENLTSVNFTNIYSVGWGAFSDNANLGSIQFDDELVEIWGWAFAGCTSISEIRFTEGNGNLNIREHAFDGCTGTTFWIDLPANTKKIFDGAFFNTGFNYIKIFSPDAEIGNDAFGNGTGAWAQFLSVAGVDTTTYEFVKAHREKGYNWKYWCLGENTHVYGTVTVAPTCTEQGYDRYGCIYCDGDEYKSNYTDPLGHNYKFDRKSGSNYFLSCKRCGRNDFEVSAIEPKFCFENALSTRNIDDAFNQSNYDARVDVNEDGFINGKDWAYIKQNIAQIDTTNRQTTIDTDTTYQTIEGWGASGAWWAPEVGTWENTNDIVKLLYSKSKGIGLNIYRYNLGAGSLDDSSLYNVGTRTDCFLNSDGTYNWNADAGARNTLYWANKYCPNVKVELFSNSAPVHMTKNGRAYGSPVAEGEDAQCNLDSSKYADFADYVVKSAEHFIEEGYNVTEVSPINEPEWGWTGWYNGDGSISCGQEGCHFEPTQARDFYNNAMIPALEASDKLNGNEGKKVELAVWECAQLNHGWWWKNEGCNGGGFLDANFSSTVTETIIGSITHQVANENTRAIRRYVDTLDTHSYWASESDRIQTMSDISNSKYNTIQHIKCSEYCQMYNDGSSGVVGHTQAAGGSTNGMGIDYGLAMADIIYQDMTILNAVEWDWWTACGKGIYTDSLVYVDANNHSNIQTSKRLWCLGNYSKFIQEGAQRIEVETGSAFGSNLYTKPENIYTWEDGDNTGTDKYNYIDTSAYLNPDGTVAIVYVNNSDTIEYTSLANSGYNSFSTYVTDETKNLANYQNGSTTEAICIPARSCTTVLLTNNTMTKSKKDAYLFAYFTGNRTEQQRVHFAVSKDGYNFTPLNNNDEIITQTKGTQNCRDPYIFKGQDGYYYLIATDMDCNTGWWGNSTSMVLWRSTDLINWTDETIIDMAQITNTWIGRCWAPQVIWDENAQKYMVYLSLYTDGDDKGTVIYYSYTDDLLDQSKYSYPQVLFAPTSGKDAIDADIIFDKKTGTYYLYYKDEDNATICYVTSNNLTGPYGDASNPQKVLNSSVALEGCNSYFINGTDTLIMLADAYLNGYFVLNSTDNFTDFTTLDNSETTINECSPRHGSVISISDEEYDALVDEFGLI